VKKTTLGRASGIQVTGKMKKCSENDDVVMIILGDCHLKKKEFDRGNKYLLSFCSVLSPGSGTSHIAALFVK
jgi:hypothetical protein